ncbi:unnamed protein product [Strongylus vulgaris]|uniref:Uncharacterized protein n=1 Tax=Strongylus vulgaris TaxID=40348 RepID=A0A3P7IPA4_STRVU|nr:unnamed protein product [Strongylus vulgaris]
MKPHTSQTVHPMIELALRPESVGYHDRLEERIRALKAEDLKAPLEGSYDLVRPTKPNAVARSSPLGRKGKVVVRRVHQFFNELKRLLGNSCRGTILARPVKMTALACGVSTVTVKRIGVKEKFVHELIPRTVRDPAASEEAMQEATLRKYGIEWGPIVKWFIREQLKKEHMTVCALHEKLCEAYADFPMSESTLRRFVKALGVTYGRIKGIPYMLV